MTLDYSRFYGGLLSTARITGGLSRSDLAKRIGKSARDLLRYESGREVPDEATVQRLATELRVSPYCFYDPLVIVSEDGVEVLRAPGESEDDFHERFMAASPPLTDEARAAIRLAGDEYWERERDRRLREG